MSKEENSYPVKISGVIEAAFLVILAQNANVIAIPIIDIISNQLFEHIHFILLTVPLINMTAIIANWLTCKIYEAVYDIYMLIEDIITLGLFYLEIYIINELCSEGALISERLALRIIGMTYALIFVLFILWNIAANKNIKSRKKRLKIKIANIQNVFLLILCTMIFILSFIDKNLYAFILYCLFIVGWIYVWLFHGHKNKLATFLTKRNKDK